MSNDFPSDVAGEVAPAIVVFGPDDKGKPHASSFKVEEAELAQKAAGLMSLHVLPLTTPEHHAVAAKLPVGRVFASGKAFVPFVGRPLYEQLCGFAGVTPVDPMPQAKSGKGSASKPKAEDIAVSLPESIEVIGQGSLVLACEGPQMGWFESIVLDAKEDDLFVLRWRDWPDEPHFARRRNQLALVPSCEDAAA